MIEYWARRKQGLRGQGDAVKPVFYAKGTKVMYITREGLESEFVNDIGGNMTKEGSSYRRFNRAQERKKVIARYYKKDIVVEGKETKRDLVGRKLTQTGVYHERNYYKNPARVQEHDPTKNNKWRLHERRAKAGNNS